MTRSGSEVEDALLAHVPPIEERYVRAALVEAERRPDILKCYPPSVVASVAISERLGIPVDSRVGAASLKVEHTGRGLEALYLPGYPAFDILIRRDPEVLYTGTGIVHDRDDFRFAYTSAARELVPGSPRLSGFLGAVMALAGARLPEDGFRHIRFTGPDPGPVVAIYAEAHYRNGAVKRELIRRKDFEGKVPESGMDSMASKAESWGTADGVEGLRGLALKRLAKGLERTDEVGIAIYLARGAEKCRYSPRSLDAARTFGIEVDEPPPFEAEPDEPVEDSFPGRCCQCDLLVTEVGPTRPVSIHPSLWSKGRCHDHHEGLKRDLCVRCTESVERAELERVGKAVKAADEARYMRPRPIKAKPIGPGAVALAKGIPATIGPFAPSTPHVATRQAGVETAAGTAMPAPSTPAEAEQHSPSGVFPRGTAESRDEGLTRTRESRPLDKAETHTVAESVSVPSESVASSDDATASESSNAVIAQRDSHAW